MSCLWTGSYLISLFYTGSDIFNFLWFFSEPVKVVSVFVATFSGTFRLLSPNLTPFDRHSKHFPYQVTPVKAANIDTPTFQLIKWGFHEKTFLKCLIYHTKVSVSHLSTNIQNNNNNKYWKTQSGEGKKGGGTK